VLLKQAQVNPLLPGVLSTRMCIKQRNRASETLLEKWTESFSTFANMMRAERDPQAEMDRLPLDAETAPLRVGERRLNLMRAFNAWEGMGREADQLPPKMFQPLAGGPSDGVALGEAEIEKVKDLYYAQAGWDVESGVPSLQKLDELGLEWTVASG